MQTDLELMDQVWSDLSSRPNANDSFIRRRALQPNLIQPSPESAGAIEPIPPSRSLGLGADEVAALGDRTYPEPQRQPQPQRQPLWPGPIENFMPRRQFVSDQPATPAEPPTDVYGKPITSDNPFEAAYQDILKREREAEFKDRGFLGGVASDVAGGLVDYGELGLRGVRTMVPKGSALEEAATSGIDRINRFKEETPFFQQDPNAGYLSRSFHGGIRSATQSIAAGLPTAAAGAAMGSALGPAGTAIGAVLGFAFGGATQFGLAQYDDVMERGKPLVDQGKLSHGDLQASAIRQGLYEGGFEFASDLLGGWLMGAGKLLTAPAKQALQATIRDMTKVGFKEFAKRAAGLTAAETSTEMVTQALQSEEDYRLGLGNQRFWEGAIDAFGPSVVASMIFAGLGHANVKLAQRSALKSLENPEADPKKRAAAVDAVYAALEQDHPVVASVWAQTASKAIDQKLPISTDENIMDAEARLNEARLNEQRLLPPGQGFIMREPGEVYAPYSPEFAEARVAAGERGLPAPTPREPVREQPELTVEQLDTRIKNLSKTEKSITTQLGKAKTEERREKLNQRLTDLQAQIQANKDQREALLERSRQEAANQQREADRQAKILSGLPNQPLPTDMADLELEQQYLDSVRRSAPAGDNLVDLDAVAKREQQIQTAIDAEEIYRQRFERTKVLDRRIGNLEKMPNLSEKQKQNLESFKQERTELQDYEDQATKLGIRFIGMQMQAQANLPPIPLFNDNNGATFTIMEGESLEDALKRKRGDFAEKKEETSIAIEEAANEAATSPKNELPEPTQAQIEAGNYRKGHIDFQGLDISIENPRGSTRKGVSPEGKPWETELTHHYGYLKGTVGKDKDHIDSFIGPEVESDRVFVVDQVDPKTGKFDEHKVMLGFQNQDEARKGYLSNYDDGWKGLGAMTEMSMDEFKAWAKSNKTRKPVADLGKEAESDRQGEGGLAGPLREGEEPGGAIQEPGPGGTSASAGGMVQKPEGGEGEVIPSPEGITIETPETPKTPEISRPSEGKLQVGSSVKWTDRKGIEHTGIVQQWFRNTANIKDEGGKIYAVKRDKLTAAATEPTGPIVQKEPEKPAKESMETPAVTTTTKEKATEPVSMGQETAEKTEEGAEQEAITPHIKTTKETSGVWKDGYRATVTDGEHKGVVGFAWTSEGATKEAEKGIRERERIKERREKAETPAQEPDKTEKSYAEQMKEAKTADEGRAIIRKYEEEFATIEKEAGLASSIGEGGSGFVYRGYSTLSKTEKKKILAAVTKANPELGTRLTKLMDDIYDSEVPWQSLLGKEQAELKGAADQIQEMSMDEIDSILDEGEKAAQEKEQLVIEPETIEKQKPAFKLGDQVEYKGERWEIGFINNSATGYAGSLRLQKSGAADAESVNYVDPRDVTLISEAPTEPTPAPEQEPPTEITIEPIPVGGPRAPKGPRQPRPKRTAGEIAKSAAEHGVKGIDEAISGLYELFGGKAVRSFPGGIDEDTYQKAKPHFQKALEEFQAAGKDVKAFVKWAYDSFSSKIKPYLRRFIQEMKKIKPEAPAEVEMEEGGGEGITIETEGEEGTGKKKRTKKLLDTGEKLGGKRSSKDHRERSEAIEIELNGDTSDVSPKALAEFLIDKTTRSKHLKVDHAVEGRTPGTSRFLNTFRSMIATWPDAYKGEMGVSRRRRTRNVVEILERYLQGGWVLNNEEAAKNQAHAKKSAAEYISILEQLNDAVSSAVTVGEARQNIMKLLVGEEQSDKWLIEEDRQVVIDSLRSAMQSSTIAADESILTDTGKSLANFLGRKWDFAHFLVTGWETIAETELDETKNKPIVRKRRNIFEITTPDHYRNGRDVTPEELLEAFALRGLDFGEWVEADFRQRSVNLTYDSFKMLAEALGANDKGISLSDAMRLGIGWGARGRGGRTAAEFYPDNKVIALTKTKGDGSLAHEWAHAFDYMTEHDNFWADAQGRYVNAINDIKVALGTFYNTADLENLVMDLLRGVWSQARSRTGRLQEAKKFLQNEAIDHLARQTRFESDAIMLDGGERGKYYSKKEEMFARAFEAYVSDKLQGSNTYLVDAEFVAPGAVEIMFNREHGAYPSEKERERFNRLFDDFFSQIEWSKDGIPKLKADYVPVTTLEKQRAQEAIDAMMERIDKIYEALYGGEQSEDGLYWYAFEQTGRGVAAQPKGYIAYDDSYDLKKELEATGASSEGMAGKGAVAYTEQLKADEVLMYFLKPIQYNEADTKIILEVPDGTITDLGHRGAEALEEAPPEHVRPPGEAGAPGAGGPGSRGEISGSDTGPAAGGGPDRTGEGVDIAEIDLSPIGGGGTDLTSGSDAFQPTGRIDYTIRANSGLEQTNQTERFNNNIAAIRTLKQIEAEGRLATAEEQALLVKYSGWGELSEALSRYPSDTWKGRAEIVASVLSEDEIQAIRRSSLDAYYTAPTVAHNIYEGLQRLGFSGGKVLEPSCGVGHFFGTMPETIRRNSTLTGVDIDGISARITGQLYQNANVLHQPFEETQIPDNFYDLTISNVPFGDSTPYDRKHNPNHWPIHDYFINKMIAITKPGGLIVAITSTGTLDKHSQDARKKYTEEADLLGAIRLPNGIFPGALAGADILYFRKKGEGLAPVPDLGDWVGTTMKKMPAVNNNGTAKGYDDEVKINNFFLGNPDRVIGSMAVGYNQYGGARVQVTRRDDFAEKLTEAIDKLPTSIYSTAFIPSEINILDMIPEESDLKDFNYYVGDDGKIYQAQGGNPKLIDNLTPDQTEAIKRLIKMRGVIRTLLRAQASDKPAKELDALRKKLREGYDAFVKKHGAINLRANQRIIGRDPDAGLLFSLENWDRDTKTVKGLADIFTKNTVAKVTPPTSAETAEESLVYSLMWRGRVDLPYMSKLTGKMQDTLVNELKGKIFDDPERGYVTSDEYLSGNVRKKLATARAAAELDPKYKENVEALEIALPVDLPMEDIRARLGSAWVPADIVRRFVVDLFGGYLDGFHLDHVVQTGLWTPHFRGRTKAQAKRNEQFAQEHSVASNEYGVTDDRGRNRINLFKVGNERGLLDFALNGGFPKIMDEVRNPDGTTREVLNIQLTDAANAKVDALQARFSAWISESEEVSKELREIYNERFNSFVERQYDGSHLTFPGKVPDELIKLRPHQKNAVWRFLQSGATYLAHEVGTGKTFTMIGSIMEAKRMGLARKAVMATKKANMEQIAADFLRLYPGANVLVMKIPENAEKRKRVFARIATGNYDCIIVNHDSFEKIPLSVETQREIINREVQNYERALEEAVMANAARHTVRDIQKRINKLKAKLQALADMERDDVPTFEEMGIDMVVVDEVHTHKNIGFQTKYGSIKGVEANGSNIAFDLFMKTQYLHARNGRGILFASGTPLTNSVGELFNISRYLHPRELERFGIATFDAWANTFGVMKKEAEYAPEGGGFKLTSRFAEFVNIPELMALMRQQMDIRTAEELGIPRPDLIGGKPTAVDLEQNEFVQEFQEILKQRVRNYRASPKHATYLGRPDNMLRIVNDGRLVAMDPRLYDPSAQDYAESKSNVCVDKVWELYQKPVAAIDRDSTSKTFGKPYKEKNHLQLIFADRGVPGGRGFNLYADIKKKLVAKGVPAEQIAFAHDYPTDDQKAELYKKARAGEIRVLLGSTGLMGIGVNVQDRVSFLHHLDVDWTYANYEQRNGRGWRFGNRVQEIGIFNYGVKKTVDAFMWSTVAYKEKILQQVMSNDPKIRNVQDVSKTSMEASEMEGLLADDPMHKEKIELDAEVRRLSNIKSEYEASRRRAREKLARSSLEIRAADKTVANNHLHLQIAEAITAFEVGNVPGLLPRDQGVFFDLEKDGGRANKAAEEAIKKIPSSNKQVVMLGRFGRIVSAEVMIREKDAKTGKDVEKKKTVKRFYPLFGALYSQEKRGLLIFSIGKDIKYEDFVGSGIKYDLTTIKKGLKANIKEKLTATRSLREEVPKLKKLVATPWDKERELAEKERRLRQVTEDLLRRQDEEDARARAELGQQQAQQQAQGEIVLEPEEEEGGRQGFSLLSEAEGRETGEGGLRQQDLEAHLAPLISKWTNAPVGGVRVVQSQKELPSRIVERARGKEIEGVYDPGTGSVWLVVDNLPSLERAEEVLAHEVYGHFGLEAFLGKKKADAFLAEVAMLYGKEGLKAIAEQHGFDLSTKEGRLKAAGEKLARMAENGERPGLLRRIYAAIRAALREAGFKIKLDDADIQRMLTRSRKWVEGGKARQGVAETQPLSVSDFQEGRVDPEILFSLSARDLLDKLQSKLEGTPKSAIDVVFGRQTDLGELAASFGLPAWLGKNNATVRGFQERQDRRDKDRSKIVHDYLKDTEALYNLSDKDQVKFDKLAFELDGKKVVKLSKFKKTGTRQLIKGPQREIIEVPVYELNEEHYKALDDYLKKEKQVPDAIRSAYMNARKALDRSLLQTYERLQEIKKLDPNLIEEYRNQMGQIENYWPHVREGNYHIRVVDPKADAKTEEPVKYREDFNAAGERHARFWYAKNIDRIAAEVKKDNPGIDLKSLEWTVERNKDMPEEVYDFPIALDAMQMVADAAVDKMPEESGIKEQLRKEFSQEISNVLKSRGHGAHFIKRRDIPGYQKTNAAKVLYNHFSGFSGWLTKMEAAHDYGDMLREIQAREHPGEYRWAVRYVHDMLQNQTGIDRAVDNAKAFFFMKYLGLGIKTMAVNLTQNPVVGIPRLSMDIGIAGAGRQFAKAVRDIRLDITEKRIEGSKGRLSADEKRLLGDMFAEGWGQSQFLNEIRGKVGGKTGKVFGKVARVMGYPMEISEKYNRLSLGLAAFRAAREGTITNQKTLDAINLKKGEKASYDVAKAFAETVVKDSHFVFGKGNRPQFMRGTAGGKALSAVFTFRTFSYNQLSFWRWMLASGDKEGKKAFAYSLLSMIMLGGLSAIPLYNSLAALIREIFGEDLLGNGVRKQLPPSMRDLVMYGGPSLVGVNIGGSIGMELPVIDRLNVNKSISGQLGEGIGSLLGVPYSMFDELTKAVDALKSGRPDRAAETVAPNFLKNIMSAERLYREGQTTVTGKPVNVPGERFPRKLTEGEAVGKALGFQPVSSTKAFEIYKSLEQLKSYRDEKQSELANRYVAAMRQNDQKEMVAVRNEAREWNRAAVVEGRRDMRIDLQKAIQSRQKARQPMKQMRGLAKEYRENYGM